MKKLILILFFTSSLFAQNFIVKEVSGDVKYQNGNSENWIVLQKGSSVNDDAIIITADNSFVKLEGKDVSFRLTESSAVSVSSIKKMNTDDLLLALAMEDMMNAPKDIETNSDNTAVYGTEAGQENTLFIKSDNFGIKRLNGAVQLAKSNLQESAVVAARETYRKYPETKSISSYRIYFADILYEKGLYEEALDEYVAIQKLQLSEGESAAVNEKTESIKMKLLGG
jgi:TolA-binding protein